MTDQATVPCLVGAPNYLWLETTDVPGAIKFYTELFGWVWNAEAQEFYLDGKSVGSCGEVREGEQPAWHIALRTDDAAATAAAVVAAGGTVVSGPEAIEGMGERVSVIDATGARVEFWDPKGVAGLGVMHEAYTPTWFELLAQDFTAASAFYQKAAGWQGPIEGMEGLLLNDAYEKSTAMIIDLKAEGAYGGGTGLFAQDFAATGNSAWMVSFHSDAAADGADQYARLIAKAKELGGTVPHPPADDSDADLCVTIVDPFGAAFNVIGATVAE